MDGKRIILTRHAKLRFLERKVPLEVLEKMLTSGVRLVDPLTSAVLCLYKYNEIHYTLVIVEEADKIIIITCYESSEWQVQKFHEVKGA